MQRTIILSLLSLAAAVGASAVEPPAASSAAAVAKNAPAGTPAAGATTAAATQSSDKQPADAQATPPGGDVKMSGMSILGNEDAPKSLVLVPWKSSQLGDMPSVSRLLDSTNQPVDKDVFLRELSYYEFKSGSK